MRKLLPRLRIRFRPPCQSILIGYRSRLDAKDIRTHVLKVLRNRSNVLGKLLRARVGRFADLVLRGRGNPVLLDPEIVLELFWPAGVPGDFDDLAIRTIVVATNYSERNEAVFQSGPLSAAVAGSMVHSWAVPSGGESGQLADRRRRCKPVAV